MISGEDHKFEIAFTTYYPRLLAYAKTLVRSKHTAEDLVNDVFVKLWFKKDYIYIHSSLTQYLFKSVYFECINYLNRNPSRHHSGIPVESDIYFSEAVNDGLFTFLEKEEVEKEIYKQIEGLPDQCKEIFKLSRFEDLSYKEIADRLKISENTVKVQISRALTKLRKTINPIYQAIPLLIQIFNKIF